MDQEHRKGLSQHKFHVGRIESLTDGIFAIAMTLLVLDLRVGADSPYDTVGTAFASQSYLLARQLLTLVPSIASYVFSFFLAAFFWWSYHRMLQRVTHSDNGLVWWNILFLFFVSMLPFTTHVGGAFPGVRLAVEIYCGNLIALAALLLLQWHHVNARGLVDPDHLAGRRLVTVRLLVLFICYSGAAVYGWFDPPRYFFAFFAIPLFMALARRLAVVRTQ